MNMIFIGLVGSGYKAAAREAARLLDCKYVDTDEVLTRNLNLTLRDYYSLFTPDALADLSVRLATQLAAGENYCIAVGDALLTVPKALKLLTETGWTVYPARSPEEVMADCDEPEHPLLGRGPERLLSLYEKRLPLFEQAARFTAPYDGNPEAFARMAVEEFHSREQSEDRRVRLVRELNEDLEHLTEHLNHRFSLHRAPEQLWESYITTILSAIEEADRTVKEYMDQWI